MFDVGILDPSTLHATAGAMAMGSALCVGAACQDCEYVSKEECQLHMAEMNAHIQKHEGRLNAKDVSDGKMETKLDMQTWLLSGIFGVTLLSFLANIVKDFM